MSSCPNVVGDDLCHLLAPSCPQLASLELWRCSSLSGRGLRSLGDLGTVLEELDIGWCAGVNAVDIEQLLTRCTAMQR